MTPPLLPRIIAGAFAGPADRESVVGDLHEEFALRFVRDGRNAARRWYWSQTLRSVPPLLSYARSRHSLWAITGTTVIVVVLVIAMMCCYDLARAAISTIYTCADGASDLCAWPYFVSGWFIAALFGAILTAAARSSIRLTIFASIGLVLSIAIPTAFGFSSPLPLLAWALLLGAIPAMSVGSALYSFVRTR